MNRQSFLHDINCLCPLIAIFVKNCYSTPSRLFIVGGTEITQGFQSQWRFTQGDPVTMAIYGIGVTPLINTLTAILSDEYSGNVNVLPYADDF